jgi:hypothetical protein
MKKIHLHKYSSMKESIINNDKKQNKNNIGAFTLSNFQTLPVPDMG